MKKLVTAAAVAAVLMNSAAFAASGATLSDVSGKVLVNSGDGFVPATGSMSLSVGDKVLVGEGSFAVLSYADCAVSVSKPSVVTVAGGAACDAAPADAAMVQPAAYMGGVPLPVYVLAAGGIIVGGLFIAGAFDDKDNFIPVSAP